MLSRARLLAALLGIVCAASVPAIAMAQDGTGDDPSATTPTQTAPDQPAGPDDVATDPSVEPPAVLQDPSPGGDTVDVAPAPTDDGVSAPAFAPPVNDLSRFSDDQRAPLWQQRDSWRPRGIFYQRRAGWFVRIQVQVNGQQVVIWFTFRDRRWERCPQPGSWQPPVVRPVPVADPSPGVSLTPLDNAVQTITAPKFTRPVPQQHEARLQFLRRQLQVCQNRYLAAVRQLRVLRQQRRISFAQYRRGVLRALAFRQRCRAQVFAHFRR